MQGEQLNFSRFASKDMKANLAVLIEKGECKVNATASIVTMPTIPDYTLKSKANLDPLPMSAKDIYFKQHKKGNMSQQDSDFFDDNWYFVELHQSILQESTQNK
jgi:hypothetical protein